MPVKLAYSDNKLLFEGRAKLLVPAATLLDPHHSRVFYNADMQFNRSLSSIFIKQALSEMKIKNATCFDGFSGIGVRGIRYLLEAGVNKVVFSEANDDAIPYIQANLKLNKIPKTKATILHEEVFPALAESESFDVIELDPFGTPVHALDAAFNRLNKQAVLSVTFTDLANLCGSHAATCRRHYDVVSINCSFSHELALRIALGKIARVGAMYDFAVKPLTCWYQGHYIKCILQCSRSAAEADACLRQMGYGWLCRSCLARGVSGKSQEICPNCTEAKLQLAGPFWVGPLGDASFSSKCLKSILKFYSEKQQTELREFISLLSLDYSGPPLFYSLPEIAKFKRTTVPKIERAIKKLRAAGFTASRTHFDPQAIKSSAPIAKILSLL